MLLSPFVSLQFIGGAVPRVTALLAIPAVIIVAKSIGLYDRDELLLRKTTLDEAPQLFHVATVVALVGALLDDKLVFGSLSKEAIGLLWASSFTTLLLFRYAARSLVTPPRPRRALPHPRLRDHRRGGHAQDGRHPRRQRRGGRPHLLRPRPGRRPHPRLERAIAEGGIGRVIVAPEQVEQGEILDVVRAIKAVGVNVTLVPRIFEVLGSSVVFDDLSGLQLLAMRRLRMSRSSLVLKRSLDLAVSGLGLLVAAPALLAIAAAIKLDTRGPCSSARPASAVTASASRS